MKKAAKTSAAKLTPEEELRKQVAALRQENERLGQSYADALKTAEAACEAKLAAMRETYQTDLETRTKDHVTALNDLDTARNAEIAEIRAAHDASLADLRNEHKDAISSLRKGHQETAAALHEGFLGELAPLRHDHKRLTDESTKLSKRLGRADAIIAIQHDALTFYKDAVEALAKEKLKPESVVVNMNVLMIDRGQKADKAITAARKHAEGK